MHDPGEQTTFLVSALTSPDPEVRDGARSAFCGQGADAVPFVRTLLHHADGRVRHEAVSILASIGGKDVADVFAEFLQDERQDVREDAESGLKELGLPAVVPVLRELIIHADSPRLRTSAAHVLGHVAQQERLGTVRSLVRLLQAGVSAADVPMAAYEALDRMLMGHDDGRRG